MHVSRGVRGRRRSRPPGLARVQTVAAVVEHGTIAAAARSLGLNHSTVSRQWAAASRDPDVVGALARAGILGDMMARVVKRGLNAHRVQRVTWKGKTTETHHDPDHAVQMKAVELVGRFTGALKAGDEHQHLHLHPRQVLAAVADLPPDYLQRIVAGEDAEEVVAAYRALRVRQLRETVAGGLAEPRPEDFARADQEPEHLDAARMERQTATQAPAPAEVEDW